MQFAGAVKRIKQYTDNGENFAVFYLPQTKERTANKKLFERQCYVMGSITEK